MPGVESSLAPYPFWWECGYRNLWRREFCYIELEEFFQEDFRQFAVICGIKLLLSLPPDLQEVYTAY